MGVSRNIMATKDEFMVSGGKIRYGRDILIQLKELPVCKEVPPNLKTSSVFTRDGGHTPVSQGGGGSYHYGNRQPDKKRLRVDQPKKILVQPIEKIVLHKAEKPWMPMAKGDTGDRSAKKAQTAKLYHKFQVILNKLTPQMFQTLAEQALKLEINTEERLSGCTNMIFTKALEEPSLSIAFANLCKVMSPIKVEYQSEDGKTKQTNFRRMLLTKCQKEFEKNKKDDESRESMQKEIDNAETDAEQAALKEELEFAITKNRKRSLGNICFIGELFKLQMLSETIMHECISRLLKSTSDEESLECFSRLITTTGRDLDKKQAKGRMDAYFKRITDIIKKGKVPARIRSMLQDVLELRENSWVPRVRQDQQLKTMDQVRPTHRVLLPQGHQQIHAMPLNTGGMGHGLMQNAPRQSNLFSQQYQQMVPSHQYPPQFTSLQTQQQPMMRPQYNPMVVYSTEQQQQQQQSGHHLAQQTFPKRKSSAIKIIDPDTNTEVIGTGEQQQHPPPFGITPSTPSSAGATSYRVSYDREFLLRIMSECTEPPPGLEKQFIYTKSTKTVNAIKAWRPHSQQSDKLSDKLEGDENRVLYHKFQGILNKLTPQKFSALSHQALQLEINTEERLEECAEMVLNNVTAGPQLAMIYANLCKRMASIRVELTSDKEVKNFQQMIHCKCWRNIEEKYEEERVARIETDIKRADTKLVRSLLEEEIELILEKRKMLSLGSACFIGELFKLRMLSETVIHECITHLLSSKSDELSLVCFARLITITGKELDKGKAQSLVSEWFQRIKAIIQKKKKKNRVCPRVRFMLQDVVKLREKNWINQTGLTARAMYGCVAEDDDEISFDENDIIKDIEVMDWWWRGTREVDGSNGLFPSDYVELI